MDGYFSMSEAAKLLNIHRLTLYRWERAKKISAAKRVRRNNQRVYSEEDIQKIREWKDAIIDAPKHGKMR